MRQNLINIISQKNEMVKQGQIVEATEKFFASEAKTIDFDGTITNDKNEMIGKMQNFAGAIQKVNNIILHYEAISGHVSFAEYTFHFKMNNGSEILWHEIIRSVWRDGKIVEEQYFKN